MSRLAVSILKQYPILIGIAQYKVLTSLMVSGGGLNGSIRRPLLVELFEILTDESTPVLGRRVQVKIISNCLRTKQKTIQITMDSFPAPIYDGWL
jgi:hypothetical protein